MVRKSARTSGAAARRARRLADAIESGTVLDLGDRLELLYYVAVSAVSELARATRGLSDADLEVPLVESGTPWAPDDLPLVFRLIRTAEVNQSAPGVSPTPSCSECLALITHQVHRANTTEMRRLTPSVSGK